MAGRRIYSQPFVRYSAFVPADEYSRAVFFIINFCIFIQQQLRADDFQIPPHRQAVTVMGNLKHTSQKYKQDNNKGNYAKNRLRKKP